MYASKLILSIQIDSQLDNKLYMCLEEIEKARKCEKAKQPAFEQHIACCLHRLDDREVCIVIMQVSALIYSDFLKNEIVMK